MRRNMKKIVCIAILLFAAIMILSMPVLAGNMGTKAFGDIYYKVVTIATDPGTPPSGWTLATGTYNISIPDGQKLCIAVENMLVSENATDLRLDLTGTSLMELALGSYYGLPAGGTATLVGDPLRTAILLKYHFRFVPQPDWHVVIFNNAAKGAATVTKITASPRCYVPSLTEWGLGVLVLVLLASTAFVIYRRRKAVVA